MEQMAQLPPYHIGPQSAYALLLPVAADLRHLEQRTGHYLSRLHLQGEADRAALAAAHGALATAFRALEQVIAAQRPSGDEEESHKPRD
jgi:hypothetical protein